MGHDDRFADYEPMDARDEERQAAPSRQAGPEREPGRWRGYVMPYRYYGNGYQGVGYYSVMYQGPGDESGADAPEGDQRTGRFGGAQGRGRPTWAGRGGRSGDERGTAWREQAELRGGRFRGQGPRGYQRSDERIREEISDRLMEHGEIDASDIEVTVKQGEVTLAGTVPDRWTKRQVEDIAEECMGVRDVMNQLKVQDGTESSRSSGVGAKASTGRSSATRSEPTTAGSSPARTSGRQVANGTREPESSPRR